MHIETRLHIILFTVLCPLFLSAQITTPVIRANFGVDADLRSNYFNGLVQSGNDDWFSLPGSVGTGQFVIDTTGAAAMINQYATDLNFRKLPFFRTMSVPAYSIVNNRLLIDAVFIRDYHGDDSTIFASGANKNGMSPADWSCPVSQQIPDKNDILDMLVHIRRAGPNKTDSLWMFGGVSIENTTGNRYFDFEMYQTDIYYDRTSRQFYNYGPDAGHTSWKFDAAGEITQAGDIIFTAEYSSTSLTQIEPRIWIDKADLSITPVAFNWGGLFDGAVSGSQFGYANISPKTAGAFYAGLQCGNNTWAGPFSLIREDNSIVTNYNTRQFMEFSVNLSKLGLDPVTLLGSNDCGMPFRRVLVKSRASTSFTAELKDFIGPFDFFLSPRVQVSANIPVFCSDNAISDISVLNPSSTSLYLWSTPDGHIITNPPEGTTIRVDEPGTYIVTQYLQGGCSVYATDTVTIIKDTTCVILKNSLKNFQGVIDKKTAKLNWTVTNNQAIQYFNLERSTDGIHFVVARRIENISLLRQEATYNSTDPFNDLTAANLYYRLNLAGTNGSMRYSRIIQLPLSDKNNNGFTIMPNPVKNQFQLNIRSNSNSMALIQIFNMMGKKVFSGNTLIQKENTIITLDNLSGWERGVYEVAVKFNNNVFFKKMLLVK